MAKALSDEEIITRAIKAAFPRPGPWLIFKHPDIDPKQPYQVGYGEVWEVYFGLDASNTLAELEVSVMHPFGGSGIAVWCQNTLFGELVFCPFHMVGNLTWNFDKIDPATGIVEWMGAQVDGISNVDTTAFFNVQTDAQGYIITNNLAFLTSSVGVGSKGFWVLARRRFDLE